MKLLTAMLILVLALPASALAAKHPAPKPVSIPLDNSGVSQYLEVIPTVGGGRPSGGVHSHPSTPQTASTPAGQTGQSSSAPASSTPSAVAPSTRRALVRQGAPGRQTARVANDTAPSGIQPLPVQSEPISLPSPAPVSAAGLPVGAGLPIVLIAVTIGVLALSTRRRRVS